MRRLFLPGLALLLPVSALAAAGRFDGLYGQDAFAYYDYAIGPLRESLLAFRPWPPFFWPPGYPLLISALSLVTGKVPLAGQTISLLAGSLTPVFTALLVREVRNDASDSFTPFAAGLTVALTGQLWQSSAVVMADTTGVAAATLGAWALARYGRQGGGMWLALAGVSLAFATFTRWIYGLVALPCAVYASLVVVRRGRAAVGHAALALLAASVFLAPLLGSAFSLLSGQTTGLASFAGNLQTHHWHPLHAIRREFDTPDGHLRYSLPNGLYYALAPAHRYYFTPLLALFLLPGLWAVWHARARSAELWWLVVGWAVIVYLYHAGDPYQNFRFTLAYLPPLAALAALGAQQLRTRLRRWRWRLGLWLVIGWGAMALGGWQLTQDFVARKDADLETVRQVEGRLPGNARLLTFGLTLTFQHYSALDTLELYSQTPSTLSELLADGRPTFVLVDAANIESQWAEQPLGETYLWLRESLSLSPIAQFGAYTLSRVNRSP